MGFLGINLIELRKAFKENPYLGFLLLMAIALVFVSITSKESDRNWQNKYERLEGRCDSNQIMAAEESRQDLRRVYEDVKKNRDSLNYEIMVLYKRQQLLLKNQK
jgi:hypothetical protein